MRRTLWLSALIVVASACAPPHPPSDVSGNRDTISAPEIEAAHVADGFELIQKLRGEFLRTRGPTSFRETTPDPPQVYVDGRYYGPVESLRNIQASEIAMVHLLRAADATLKYGTGHTSGIIEVTTKR